MNLKNEYYNWLLEIIQSEDIAILKHLFDLDYEWIHPMDSNRYEQGIEYRYKFGREKNIDDRIIANKLDNRPCSILEMLIALSYDIEQVMYNTDYGDRIGEWFWLMVNNIIDDNDDEQTIDNDISYWLNRQYDWQGNGNIFRLENPPKPLNEVDTWLQAMWYFTDNPDPE